MKQTSWKFMLLIISIGALVSVYELVNNTELLVSFIIGMILFIVGFKMKKRRRNTKSFCLLFGTGMMILTGMQTIGTWISLVTLVIFIIFFASKFLSKNVWENLFQQKKAYHTVTMVEPTKVIKRKKQQWVGEDKIGKDVYEWDDVNITTIAGDTIIDIGNTILPNEENIVVIRKGFGRIRLIVPIGVGISVHHSALVGEIDFLDEPISLKNETIELKSTTYYQTQKKIKIYTSILFGKLEVIEL